MEREMKAAAANDDFERAAEPRDRVYALRQIRDMAALKKDEAGLGEFIDVFGRIEGYDISNPSGTDAVGSLVVFKDGRPRKSDYRKFIIKTVSGPNDVAMLTEVLRRRLSRLMPKTQNVKRQTKNSRWPRPDLILIDGGTPQLNAAKKVLAEFASDIPLVGIAKGPDRKQDELVYDKSDIELARLVTAFRPLLQRVRDEAHRFAVSFHRSRSGRRLRRAAE